MRRTEENSGGSHRWPDFPTEGYHCGPWNAKRRACVQPRDLPILDAIVYDGLSARIPEGHDILIKLQALEEKYELESPPR